MKNKKFLSKIFYSIRANFLEMIVSVVVTLLVPKFLGNEIEQYGYFQVYLFYVAYVGFFHFGWCDGILLREGGKRYEELNKELCASQFYLIIILEIILALIASLVAVCLFGDEYRFVYTMVALNAIIYTPRRLLQYYLQSTSKIKEYAQITEVGRGIYGAILLIIIVAKIRNYKLIVFADLVGKTCALFFSIYICRDIVFSKVVPISEGLKEAYDNISVGIKLMFANIASMLITGIVRWGIQIKWDITTYGKISFSLSISNFLLSFISAIAVVLYPTLKRVNDRRLSEYYGIIRSILMVFLFTCLLLYYPFQVLLSYWLPQYEQSIKYMAMLFPVCVYATKMALLVQTYMNVFRLEKLVMTINCAGVGIAAITTYISVFLLHDLSLAMASIVFNQMFRCVLAEYILSKYMKISLIKDIVLETVLVILFIVFHWYIGGTTGLIAYCVAYLIYLFINRFSIKNAFVLIKSQKNAK